jgi:uncharacterized protein (TIGR02996 family)
MSQEALWQAILADPDDDTPRLVYADWLEEHGDEADRDRAEFIRLQIERARLPEFDPRRPVLKSREQELLDRHGGEWRKELPGWLRSENCWFRRGFVARVSLTAARFLRGRNRLLDGQAPLEGVWLRNMQNRLAEVAASPRLVHMRELIPQSVLGAEELLASPHLAGLQRLDLNQGAWVDDIGVFARAPFTGLTALNLASRHFVQQGGLRQLLSAPFIPGLEDLDLSSTRLCDSDYWDLARAPLPRLRALRLGNCPGNGSLIASELTRALASGAFPCLALLDLAGIRLGDEGFRPLATAPWATQLRSLRLEGLHVESDGLQTLVRADALAGVVAVSLTECRSLNVVRALADRSTVLRPASLQVHGWDLGADSMRRFGNSPVMKGVWHLNLSYNGLTATTLKALLGGGPPPQLVTLNLFRNNMLEEGGMAVLARSGWLNRLSFLDLGLCSLGDRGAQALASTTGPLSLRELSLANNEIGPEGARALAESPLLGQLRTLELPFNGGLGDKGVIALASSPHLTHLQRLNLDGCNLGPRAALALARSPHLTNLAELNLQRNDLPESGARALLDSPHLGRLRTLTWYSSKLRRATVQALYARFDMNRNLHID